MRIQEIILESQTASADEIWQYVQQLHPADQQGGGFLERLVQQYPRYELRTVPLASLHIPDQAYDDEEQNIEDDPHGRTLSVDSNHAGEYSQYHVDRSPIVVDANGYILDGNHRAWAAAELLGRDTIQAWVPIEQLSEVGDTRTDYEPNRKRRRSLFHATVDGYWVDVFFDRSFTGSLQITFTVNQNYEPSQHRKIDQGTVFRIFSAVQQIIKERLPEYMRTARPPRVTFTAKGDSRVKLYRRMFVPLVTEILGPKWQLSEHPGPLHLFFWEPVKKNETNPT